MASKRCRSAVDRWVSRCGMAAYKKGRERFRIRHDTLAARLGYGVSTIREALRELREEGRVQWIRTGRSCIYWLPYLSPLGPENANMADESPALRPPESGGLINRREEAKATEAGKVEVEVELTTKPEYKRLPDGSIRYNGKVYPPDGAMAQILLGA